MDVESRKHFEAATLPQETSHVTTLRSRPTSLPAFLACATLLTLAAPRPASAVWPQFGRAVSTAAGDQLLSSITTDGAAGGIITWVDFRDSTANIFAGHVLASGEVDASWPANGRALRTDPLMLANEPGDPANPVVVPDGAGGAIVAWQDDRSAVTETDIFTQHVLASGVVDPAWPANGAALCRVGGLQVVPSVASDGAGGAIVTWMDGRAVGTSNSVDVYAQHVLASGLVDARWPMNGLAVSTASGPQEFPVIVEDGAGGAIIAWFDLRFDGTTGFDIYAQHVLNSGIVDPAWPVNGRALCTDPSDQFNPTITSDGAHGAIVAWDDNRNQSFHPFATRVLASGVVDPAWPVNGLAISNAGIQEDFPQPVPDGAGGAIVTWQTRDAFINLHAQHLLATGVVDPAWPVNGRVLAPGDRTQTGAAIAPDGAGGAIVAWQDTFDDIFAQHVLASGALDPTYPTTGRAVCNLPSQQSAPAIVAAGSGGAIVAWTDTRNGVGVDVFAMQVLEVTTGVPAPGPPGFAFRRPGPNPARGATMLRFSLPGEAGVRLAIYDVAGRRVRELVSGTRPAGEHAVGWDLRDEGGQAVAAGTYFARLEAGGRTFTEKVVTLK
jgi:flagellar hook capping protein FlgD